MIFIVISIWGFIMGIIFFVAGLKLENIKYWVTGIFLLLTACPLIIFSVNDYKPSPEKESTSKPLKTENKFIYRVDPKQNYYLIENNNYGEKRLDTVPYGHLEEYIATDNL